MTQLSRSRTRRAITIGLTLALLVFGATAQNRPDKPSSLPVQSIVKLNVLVLDDAKHAVNDVRQNEFRVFENDIEQKISFFSTEPSQLSCGLVVDNSGSLRGQFEEVIEAAKKIVSAIRPEDEAFLMRFASSDKIDILWDFTSDKSALNRSLDQLLVEGGQTALIDAVFVAAMHMSNGKKDDSTQLRRRVLFLISDGEDRESVSKVETLFEYLRKSDIQIYVIGLVSALRDRAGQFGQKMSRGDATDLLNRLATETGGRAFYPRTEGQFSNDVDNILRDLRTQFVIGYNPAPDPKSKPYRNVKVELVREKGGEKRTVVVRPGISVIGT